MRRFFASLLCLIACTGTAQAGFVWLEPWQSNVTLTQSPPSSTASAVFNVDDSQLINNGIGIANVAVPIFASEDGTASSPGQSAQALVTFSRTFQVTGDPVLLILTAAADGHLSVNYPNSATAGVAQSDFSIQMAVSGTSESLLLNGANNASITDSSRIAYGTNTFMPIGDGIYTLSGTVTVNAAKTSGLSGATADFSTGNGLSFGVQAVPEPQSIALMTVGIAAGGFELVRRQRRCRPSIENAD